MIKVFEHFDLATVGYLRSVLEAEGIRTHLKNQYTNGALGELPFVEIVPELWIVDDRDLARANALIRQLNDPARSALPGWRCAHCGEEIEGAFAACWNCGAAAPG